MTSAILFASGDIIAQQVIERKREKHDVLSHTTPYSFLHIFQTSFRAQHVSLFLEVTLAHFPFYIASDHPAPYARLPAWAPSLEMDRISQPAALRYPYQGRDLPRWFIYLYIPQTLTSHHHQTWLDQALMAPRSFFLPRLGISA